MGRKRSVVRVSRRARRLGSEARISSVCSPMRGSGRRTPGRRPPSVNGSRTTSVVPPSSVCIGTRPPLAFRCGSWTSCSGLTIGAYGQAGGLELGDSSATSWWRRISPSRCSSSGRTRDALLVGRAAPGRRRGRARSRTRHRICELVVADGADEELLVVRQREHVVDAPRRDARRHRRRRLAGHRGTAACAAPTGTRSSRTARSAPPGRGRCARARAARRARRSRRTCRP